MDASEDSQEEENIIPDDILEEILEEKRGKVVSVFKQSMFSSIMRGSNPIADRITSDHISQLIKNSDEHDLRNRKERKSQRNYNLLLLIIGLIFIGFLIVFLYEDQDLLVNIILDMISFIGGLGFGKSFLKNN